MNISDVDKLMLQFAGVRAEARETRAMTARSWLVGNNVFAWQRPLSKKDVAATGVSGEVIAVHVADLGEKAAWISTAPETCFDSPHFKGYPAVLINLEKADAQVLLEIAEAACERARA